jgi:site-specific DNA-methyltransferase (adenine-specific)
MLTDWTNKLVFGDNLAALRKHLPDESVDLVYLDPPFNSAANYNVLFQEKTGEKSAAQITAFEDTWHWGAEAEDAYHELVTSGPEPLVTLMQTLRAFLGSNDMMAYLTMMAPRLVELHRVLKGTGSIYLHCDPTASHYLKLLMDAVFAPVNFRSEIIWKRTSAHNSAKRYGPVHDTIFFYTKSEVFTWNPIYQPLPQETIDAWYNNVEEKTGRRFNRADLTAPGPRSGPSGAPWRGIDPSAKGRHWAIPGFVKEVIGGLDTQSALDALDRAGRLHWPKREGGMPMLKRYLEEAKGVPALDVITDIAPLNNATAERLGYPTQKPEALLELIIRASSNEGDVLLDPFCGCGTAISVAERLGRRWIGIDITHLSISLMKHRLNDAFGSEVSRYEVIGDPKDLPGAVALAQEDRYQFQWWALSLIDARPVHYKKGADYGVDGVIHFFDDNSGRARKAVVQVKSGHVKVGDVRDLKGVMEREKAEIGFFITLEEPTAPMLKEAGAAGFYVPKHFPGYKFPRLQVLTVEELLGGGQAQYPRMNVATFKKAERQRKDGETQKGLFADADS